MGAGGAHIRPSKGAPILGKRNASVTIRSHPGSYMIASRFASTQKLLPKADSPREIVNRGRRLIQRCFQTDKRVGLCECWFGHKGFRRLMTTAT